MTYWLQQTLATLALAGCILLVSLLPARALLLPLWPQPVEERLVAAADAGPSTRLFVDSRTQSERFGPVLAQTRPLSLSVVELEDGRRLTGFPVGLARLPESPDADARPAEPAAAGNDAGLPVDPDQWMPLPSSFRAPVVVVEAALTDQGSTALVLLDAEDQSLRIALDSVRRLYRPNQMTVSERIGLLASRVGEHWRALPPGAASQNLPQH